MENFAADLAAVLARSGAGVVHHVQPAAVSLTQASEAGTVYSVDEVHDIAEITMLTASAYIWMVPASPMPWLALLLSCRNYLAGWCRCAVVGATKNGAMAAEAVVFSISP